MDYKDYYNKKHLINLNTMLQLEILELEHKQSQYDKYVNDYNDMQKKIQQLHISKQRAMTEIARMEVELYKTTYNLV